MDSRRLKLSDVRHGNAGPASQIINIYLWRLSFAKRPATAGELLKDSTLKLLLANAILEPRRLLPGFPCGSLRQFLK
jgi:hypothetical protein